MQALVSRVTYHSVDSESTVLHAKKDIEDVNNNCEMDNIQRLRCSQESSWEKEGGKTASVRVMRT